MEKLYLCVFLVTGLVCLRGSDAAAQTFYQRFIVGADPIVWAETNIGCDAPCRLDGNPQIVSSDTADFLSEYGTVDGYKFSFGVHFIPRHAGSFMDTTSVTWKCMASRDCQGGWPETIQKIFHFQAVADSGFYFPDNYLKLSLKDDKSRRVVFDTFYLDYVNKSGTDVAVVGLRPLASDSSSYHLSIVSNDSLGTHMIGSTDSSGSVVGVFETVNGPDTSSRSCFVQVAYRAFGLLKFDTIYIQYHSPVSASKLTVAPDTVRFVALPGAHVDTTIRLIATGVVDTIWLSKPPDPPFHFVSSSTVDSVRTDVYTFKSTDSRTTATSQSQYTYARRLYNGELIPYTIDGPLFEWSVEVDSIPITGHLRARYEPIYDTVSSQRSNSVQVGTIILSTPCTLDSSFTILKYQQLAFILRQSSDTTWTVWLSRMSIGTGLVKDSARIYMTMSGAGCPTVDGAMVTYSVYLQPPASAEPSHTASEFIVVALDDGSLELRIDTEARVTLYTITGAIVRRFEIPADGVIHLAQLHLPSGFYYYTASGAHITNKGKIIVP